MSVYKNVLCFSSVYDCTRVDTFSRIGAWLTELETYATKPNIVKMLVGNKIDKVSNSFLPHIGVRSPHTSNNKQVGL